LVCDKTPTPPFDSKDKKNRYPKFFGLMQKVTLEFAFGWHSTWAEEIGTMYEIEEYTMFDGVYESRFVYYKEGEVSKSTNVDDPDQNHL